ncbi:MAG: DUF992 domain-containing protein [Rhizomicrobium sp.]|jgi:hypothetical protein
MNLKHRLAAGAATAVVAALAFGSQADAAGVKVGVLTCHEGSGWGFIFGSSKNLHCNFSPSGGHGERYAGTVSKFGVDIGYTAGGIIVWDVVAPESSVRRGALAGSYAGATASATAGLGVGANVLVGGLDRSIALQPVSVEGNTGLNVAAGIGAINLHYVGPEGPARVGMNGPPPDEQGPPPPGDQGPPPPPPGETH